MSREEQVTDRYTNLMADIVIQGRSLDPDIKAEDFRLERFEHNQPLHSQHPYVGAGQMR